MALRRVAQCATRNVRFQGVWSAWQDSTERDQHSGHQPGQDQLQGPGHTQQLPQQHSNLHAWPSTQLLSSFSQPTRGMAWWSKKTPPPAQPTPSELQPDPPQAELPESLPPISTDSGFPTDAAITPTNSTDSTAILQGDPGLAIQEACGQVESVALQAASDESILLGSTFISGLQAAHDQLGLPWWASIAAVNIATRSLTLPILLINQRNTARMMALNLELMPLKKLQEAITRASTREHQMAIHTAWVKRAEEVRLKHGSKLGGIMGTMIVTLALNSVVFISIFNGTSNLMNAKAPSLSTGGLLWFTDLTLPDPYYGLPVLCTLTTLAMIQYGMNVTGEQMATPEKAEQASRVKNIFRVMALMFIPFGHFVPSGVALLWASNSAFSVLLGLALRQDGIRKSVGLPTMTENFDIGQKLQAMHAADPLSFAPPPPPPPADGFAGQGSVVEQWVMEQGQGVTPPGTEAGQKPPPPAGWVPPLPPK